MMSDFNQRHPIWEKMYARWKTHSDFWRGGVSVLSPRWAVSNARYAIVDSGEKSSELHNGLAGFKWVSSAQNSYLWKHERESPIEYAERQARAYHYPVFSWCVNSMVAGVVRSRATRDPSMAWYNDDVDLQGTDADAFYRQAMAMAIVYGRVHSITDVTSSIGSAPISEAQRKERGIRPYSYLVSPLDLVDWSLDDNGGLRWGVVCEAGAESHGPGEKREQPKSRYRVWYPDHWELWQETTGEKFALVSDGALLAPALNTLFAARMNDRASWECESPMADICDGDRDIFNTCSESSELERAQTFDLLWVPEEDGAPTGPVEVGPWRAQSGSATAGPPQYVSPNPAHADGKAIRLAGKIQTWRLLAGLSHGASDLSKEERSASALLISGEDRQNQTAIWNRALVDFENSTANVAALLNGQAAPEGVIYPPNFDLPTFTNNLVQLNSLGVVPSDALKMLVAPIVKRVLSESGVGDADIAEAIRKLNETTEGHGMLDLRDGARGSDEPPTRNDALPRVQP